jgi:heme exporter protein D
MNASDLGTYLAMGGYGLYVWGSMGMCAGVFIAEMLSLRARRRAVLQELAADDTPVRAARQPVLTRQEAT